MTISDSQRSGGAAIALAGRQTSPEKPGNANIFKRLNNLPLLIAIPMFKLRLEYRQYVIDCLVDNEMPWTFRDWFTTVYWYEWQDNLEDPLVFCLN